MRIGTGRRSGDRHGGWGLLILMSMTAVGMHVLGNSAAVDSTEGGATPVAASKPLSIPERATRPQGAIPVLPAVGSGSRFLSGGSDPRAAARWSSCSPIRWTIDPVNIEASGVSDSDEIARWRSVVSSVADATGYKFDYVTAESGLAGHRPGVLPSVDGIDIVITYESADDPGDYRRPTLAEPRRVAESWLSWVEDGTGAKLASTGSIIMDYRDLAEATTSGRYQPADRVALMAHEFGHVMGLAHDEDESAAMFDEWIAGKGGLTESDIAGLVDLAKEPCSDLAPRD